MNQRQPFFHRFSNEARIQTRWQKAFQETDPESSLTELRQVLEELLGSPATLAHVYQTFLSADGLFHPRWAARVTEADLRGAEALGEVLSQQTHQSPGSLWFRLEQEYTARNWLAQSQALLARIYYSPFTSADEKRNAVLALVRWRALGDEHLEIYREYIQDTRQKSMYRAEVHVLLAALWTVDLRDGQDRLAQAHALAARFQKAGFEAASIYNTLGCYALQVEQNPARAAACFERALQVENNHASASGLSWSGLLAAYLRQHHYQAAIVSARQAPQTGDALLSGLKNLCQTLFWLENPDNDEEPPATARSLQELDLSPYAGSIASLALARLLLIEGDTLQAARLLRSQSQRSADQPSLAYYRALAGVLCGDSRAVVESFYGLRKARPAWAVGCLLLECDPARLDASEIEDLRGATPGEFLPVLQARVALSSDASLPLPGPLQVAVVKGRLEEGQESLRTALGLAFYRGSAPEMTRLLGLPLFKRLPQADQLTWRGLHSCLLGDRARTCSQLERAALTLRYPRAALLLATYLLEQDPADVPPTFDELLSLAATGGKQAKVEVLRVYKQWNDGLRTSLERQEALPAPIQPQMQYRLGKLSLLYAERAFQQGNVASGTFAAQQATALLTLAAQTPLALAAHSRVLAHVAAFLLDPEGRAAEHLDLWDEIRGLNPADQHPWLLWYALLAQIWRGAASEVAVACEELSSLLEQVQALSNDLAEALARLLLMACHRVERVGQAQRVLDLLDYLAQRASSTTVKQFSRLASTLVARLQSVQARPESREQVSHSLEARAKADPANASLALLLTWTHLKHQQTERALRILRVARSFDPVEQSLCHALALLLASEVSDSDSSLPTSQPLLPLEQYSAFLQAFTASTPEKRLEALLTALAGPWDELARLLEMRRCFTLLCSLAVATRTADERIIETARRFAQYLHDPALPLALARGFIAQGELELALQIWQHTRSEMGSLDLALVQDFMQPFCVLAVQAHQAGDIPRVVQVLHQVVALLRGNSADQPEREVLRRFSARDLERIAQQSEMQSAISYLLSLCLQTPERLPATPGRYHFLETRLAQRQPLLDALLKKDEAVVRGDWSAALASSPLAGDIPFQHGLTVVFYESLVANESQPGTEALRWQAGLARWMLLLSAREFWAYFGPGRVSPESGQSAPLSAEQQDLLLQRAARRVLSFQSSLASKAFSSGSYASAAEHLRGLELCRAGTRDLQSVLQSQQLGFVCEVDEQRMNKISANAGELLENWYEILLQEAEQELFNARAIEQLPRGIARNYAGAIQHLLHFLDHSEEKRALLSCLEWYNNWCVDVAGLTFDDDTLLYDLVSAASLVADALIPLCQSEKSLVFKRENELLATHFYYRGATSQDPEEGMTHFLEALSWRQESWIGTWKDLMQFLGDQARVIRMALSRSSGASEREDTKRYFRKIFQDKGWDPRIFAILEQWPGKGKLSASLFLCNRLTSSVHVKQGRVADLDGIVVPRRGGGAASATGAAPRARRAVPIEASQTQGNIPIAIPLNPPGVAPVASPGASPPVASHLPANFSREAETLREQGLKYLQEKRFSEAVAGLQSALNLSKDQEQKFLLSQDLAVACGEYGEDLLRKILGKRGDPGEIKGWFTEANLRLREALRYNPGHMRARENLMRLNQLSKEQKG